MSARTAGSPAGAEIVVVGGGTAGCVVAGRLVEAGHEVLVLEAGPDHGPFVGGRWPEDLLDARSLPSSHDWGYEGSGRSGHPLAFQRARVVGGCSAHNGCTQTVGWGPDYDRWAGDVSGWSAAELRPLFAVARERMRIRGWEPDEIQPLQRAFVDAAGGMGLPVRNDLDDLDAGPSVGWAPLNIVDGIRWNAAFAYLDPVRREGALRVRGDVEVDRIVIVDGRACGVDLRGGGRDSRVSAEKVVVSSGAYGTPEVLLRSGIGSADELRSIGVDPVVDLAGVGANLHDQPIAPLEFEGTESLAADLASFARDRWLPEEQTTAKLASSSCDGPYDLHVFPWIEPDPSLAYGWKVVVPVALLTPLSRGRITLRSEGQASADVDHGYLREADDVIALVDGARWTLELIRSSTSVSGYLGQSLSAPGGDGDDAIEPWIRRNHQHYWHPVGSCRMGPAGDPAAVVDECGAVHGVADLWIADASVFPRIPRATTAWPVVAAGERLASSMIGRISAGGQSDTGDVRPPT